MTFFLESRRTFLTAAAGLLAAAPLAGLPLPVCAAELVGIENFDAAGASLGTARVAKILRSEAEWRRLLPAESFEIARHAATEAPFTGAYWDLHKDGLFRCICCETALFDSRTKFDSGTGWPSFWRAISSDNVASRRDNTLGMERTAIACARCNGHLGHLFHDGPRPTGLRYCMNSASLVFVPRASAHA